MTTANKRDIATSATTLLFAVIGITGIFMYFHILDTYTKQMHEIIGLAFVVAVFLHVMVNFKSMKNYFSKKIFLLFTVITIAIVSAFVATTSEKQNPKKAIFQALFTADTQTSFLLFTQDTDLAKLKLEVAGIKMEGFHSIEEIAKGNKTSPFRIITILNNK